MSTRKLTVTTPYGVFTRKTHRTYTHVVLVCGTAPGLIEERSRSSIKHAKKTLAKYEAVIAGGPQESGYNFPIEKYEEWAQELRDRIAAEPARLEAALNKDMVAVASEQFWCETWCGRPDLAEKAAGTLRKEHRLVKIFPVDPA